MQTVKITSGDISTKECTYKLDQISVRKNLVDAEYLILHFEVGGNNESRASASLSRTDVAALILALQKETGTAQKPNIRIHTDYSRPDMYGNTYHICRVVFDNCVIESKGMEWGGRDMFFQTAKELLLSDPHFLSMYPDFKTSPRWSFREKFEIFESSTEHGIRDFNRLVKQAAK